MEIQVGEYIRTLDGIKKIVKINEGKLSTYYGKYIVFPEYKNSKSINVKNITKHSFNIIDLIEEGDYVNGLEVVTIDGYDEDGNDKEELGILETYVDEVDGIYLTDVNIKSIVTHEQMEAMEYEVK